MTDTNTPVVRGGMGLLGWLGLLFVALKLLGYISWSWWLVLLPWLIGPAVLLCGLAVFVIGLFMARTR